MPHCLTTDARHGTFAYNPRDAYVGKSFDLYGEFSEHEVSFLCDLVQPGMIVVDAGANIGALTVPLAKRAGQVIAFEPQRIVYQMLCANLALNSIVNVFAHHAALGAQRSVIQVPELEPDADQNFGGISLLEKWPATVGVPCYRLDDLKIPIVHLLKADVEGMEPEVLLGARDTIRRSQSVLYLEADRENRRDDLIRELRALEYVAFWHCPPLFNLTNHKANHENVFGEIVSINWLCVHRSQAPELKGFQRVEGT